MDVIIIHLNSERRRIIMASSEQFKEALKTGKLKEALLIAMSQGFELDITTWVNSIRDCPHPSSGKLLRTRINLVRGEIDNEIGENFLRDGVVRELEKLHSAQIATAPQILQSNLESLQKIFQLITSLQQQDLGSVRGEVLVEQIPLKTLQLHPQVSQQIVGETDVFPTFTETKANVENRKIDNTLIEEKESVSVNLEFLDSEMEIARFETENQEEEMTLDSDLDYEDSVLTLETLASEEEEGFETVDIGEEEGFDELSPEFSSSSLEELDSPSIDSEELKAEYNDFDADSEDSSNDDWGDLLDDISSEENGSEKGGQWRELSPENKSDSGMSNLDALDWDGDADWEDFDETLGADVKSGSDKN
jgi:hypothetical protein